jgi:glycogen operon protein
VYSNNATALTLVLFRRGERMPFAELPIPEAFRIGGVYAMTVLGLDADDIEYGYRAAGPWRPEDGHRFDPYRILSDPYATVISGAEHWGERPDPDASYRHRAALSYQDFDWEGDRQLDLPLRDLVIYELHVRGFTRHPSSGVAAPGTYAGLVDKIPYLRSLGVNAVELMPVFQFDECDTQGRVAPAGTRLFNYWGYSTVGFFAPNAAYAATSEYGMQVDEFKNLVKQLHKAGIEVILDVVFNHTAEGDERGPTISFRGLDNQTYYMLTPDGYYYNFSGTGNTMDCNQPVVRGFVLDCLRYWVSEFHVDGFRFDLASIFGQGLGRHAATQPAAPGDPGSRPDSAEHQADRRGMGRRRALPGGQLPGLLPLVGVEREVPRHRAQVPQGRPRDRGGVGRPAARLTRPVRPARPGGLGELRDRADGFTLNDLFSYNHKHNEANGEENRDGDNSNHSWNCGHEGPTDDPDVNALRGRQVRNALLLLLCSHGVPMLLAGDEVGRTQHGNNNAYCLDEPSWFDWSLVDTNADLLAFTSRVIAFRHAHPVFRRSAHATGHQRDGLFPEVSWHGSYAWTPDWSAHCRLLATMFTDGDDCVYLAANAHWEGHDVELPELPGNMRWHVFADTWSAAGDRPAAYEPGREPLLEDQTRAYLGPRSVVVLTAKNGAAR